VELALGGRGEQAPALRDGRADVAILPMPFREHGLDVEPLLTEPRLVALAADDPLAARHALRLADLAGHTLPDGGAADRDDQRPVEHRGELPRRDIAQLFSLIELGRCVWFVPVSVARRHPRPGIAYRPVEDLPPGTIALAWPADCRSTAVAAFVRAATAVAASGGEEGVQVVAAAGVGAAPADDDQGEEGNQR
jgi:DNA-binding transcriptional LysR family regulator